MIKAIISNPRRTLWLLGGFSPMIRVLAMFFLQTVICLLLEVMRAENLSDWLVMVMYVVLGVAILAFVVLIASWVVAWKNARALRVVCQALPKDSDYLLNHVRGLVRASLSGLANQVKQLQDINVVCVVALARTEEEKMRALFEAARQLDLLDDELKEKGVEVLLK